MITVDTSFSEPADFVEVDGIQLRYQFTRRTGKGAVVVLVHGFGASLESWTDIYAGLAEEHSVMRFDLRGHGLSSKPLDSNYSLRDQALLLVSILEKLRIQNVHLVGHSYGGGVVLMALLEHLKSVNTIARVRSLTLIDSAGYPQEFPFFVRAVESPLVQALTNLFPSTLRARVLLTKIMRVDSQVTSERIQRYARYFDLPGYSHAMGEAARALVPPDLAQLVLRYSSLAVPTQIIWGAEDPAIPVEMAHRFNADLPNSKLEIFKSTGHIPHEERPAETLAVLKKFISEVKR
ncbi:alpha/beta fold hydrolase [Ideonella sp. A 288]|uniref:alpha/beta fold hydrolase n=1 Tax=Ideonella sp. A 288 TaxID=1962181 RepID=UPI0013038265|nr:alpha/beta fold hydrolase [Ideonella sp. A 288]